MCLFWLLLALVFVYPVMQALRERQQANRRLTGHCPACNYDRRGLSLQAPCSECGAPPP